MWCKRTDSRTLNEHNCPSSRYLLSSFSACFELLCDVITKLERRSVFRRERNLSLRFILVLSKIFSSFLAFFLPAKTPYLNIKKNNNYKKRVGKIRRREERKCLFRGRDIPEFSSLLSFFINETKIAKGKEERLIRDGRISMFVFGTSKWRTRGAGVIALLAPLNRSRFPFRHRLCESYFS